jgi:hypothetical protein
MIILTLIFNFCEIKGEETPVPLKSAPIGAIRMIYDLIKVLISVEWLPM